MREPANLTVDDATFIGIDPGAKGAIAVLHRGRVTLFDMPVVLEKSGRTKKERTDVPKLVQLARVLHDLNPGARVRIERVWGIMGQGASTGAALGHNRGCLETAFTAAGFAVELVSPQSWKARAGLIREDKAASVRVATSAFPNDTEQFKPIRGVRTSEHCQGRAEAALIAKFGGAS